MFLNDDSAVEARATTLAIDLKEFSIGGQLSAPAGEGTLTMTHNLAVRELGILSADVGPGGTVDLALGTLAPGTYEVYCTGPMVTR